MESATRPPLHKQASSVIGGDISKDRRFCHWLGQQFAEGEPDQEEGGVATL